MSIHHRRSARFATAVAVLTSLASLASASPALAKTLVTYEKSGGIAALAATMTVTEAGSLRITNDRPRNGAKAVRRYKLTATERRALARALRDAHVSTLRAEYAPRIPIADGFTQTLRYGGRRITVRDGARPPARLQSLLTRLTRLAGRAR